MVGSIEVTDVDVVGFGPVPSHAIILLKTDDGSGRPALMLRMPSSVARMMCGSINELINVPETGLPEI